jgi:hypothetical protein
MWSGIMKLFTLEVRWFIQQEAPTYLIFWHDLDDNHIVQQPFGLAKDIDSYFDSDPNLGLLALGPGDSTTGLILDTLVEQFNIHSRAYSLDLKRGAHDGTLLSLPMLNSF